MDRFIDALSEIRNEIALIERGDSLAETSVLRNAPHTVETLTADEWEFTYSRQKAAYPLPWIADHKYWAPVSRIYDAHGDRNLICTCPPLEDYEQHPAMTLED